MTQLQLKRTNTIVTTANELEGGECHHGQQIEILLPKNTTYYATPLTSHTRGQQPTNNEKANFPLDKKWRPVPINGC